MRIKLSELIASKLVFGGFLISDKQYDFSAHLDDEEKNLLRYTAEQLDMSYFELIYEYEVYLIDKMLEEYWKEGERTGMIKIPEKKNFINIEMKFSGGGFINAIERVQDDIDAWRKAANEYQNRFHNAGMNAEDFVSGAWCWDMPKKTKRPIDDFHKEQRKQRNAYVNRQGAKQYKHGNYRGKVNHNQHGNHAKQGRKF